jgi:hypothetical protein
MNIVPDAPPPIEATNFASWTSFLAGLFAEAAAVETVAALLRGEPARFICYGNGALVAASETNFDLLRSIITTVSGRFGGGLDGDLPDPAIRYHPSLHRCDLARLIAKVEAEPDTAFFVVGIDCAIEGWPKGSGLSPSAGLPHPALALLRWLHLDWQLADVSSRLEVLSRWAQRVAAKPSLQVIT